LLPPRPPSTPPSPRPCTPAPALPAPSRGPLPGEYSWTHPQLARHVSAHAGALPLMWGATFFLAVILVAQIIALCRRQRRAYAKFPKSEASDAPPEASTPGVFVKP
jgi:hypothetical protein